MSDSESINGTGGEDDSAGDPVAAVATKKQPKRGLLIAAITALALIVVGGGVAFAGNQLGWFRASQPADALPAGAVGYLQLDADPSPDQKLAAFSFLRGLKPMASANANSDVKKMIWDALVDGDPSMSKRVDYDTDLKPWLGNQFGVAVYPKHNSQPVVAVAIRVTDENLAKTKIPEILGDGGSVLLGFSDGFAVITTEASQDDLGASFGTTALADDSVFSEDFYSLGDPGWAAAWGSLTELYEMSDELSAAQAAMVPSGRVAMALQFTNDTAQLKLVSLGLDPASIPDTSVSSDVGGLPADTGAVLSVKGAGSVFPAFWKQYVEAMQADSDYDIREGLAAAGIRMPEDMVTVLGDQLTVAVSEEGLKDYVIASFNPEAGIPVEMGARVTTDNPNGAKSVVDRFLKISGLSDSLVQDVQDNTYILASGSSYLDELAKESGELGTQSTFTTVVPDWQNAAALGYLDLGPFSAMLAKSSGDYSPVVASLQAIGVTSSYQQDTVVSTIILSRS